ncbi:MAG: hypothetical protein ACK54F_07050 [Planctomycetia bacterium]
MSIIVRSLREPRLNAAARRLIARSLAMARFFPKRVAAVLLIGVASLAFAGLSNGAVPARKNRHDRQE